jgi:hypothetical protein
MRYIASLAGVPRFRNEAEEVKFWASHSLAKIWGQLEPVQIEVAPDVRRVIIQQSRKKPVTLRLEERQITRAKEIARERSLNYQTLLRTWIAEAIARVDRPRRRV